MFKELCTKLGIKQNISSTFHPQTDGQSERVNQDLELYLWIFCNHQATDWTHHLPLAEFAHNNRYHDAIKTSLFQVLMGYQPWHNIPTVGTTDAPDIASRLTQLAHLCTEIQSSIRLAEETIKKCNKEKFVEYKPGQRVWLEATNLKGLHPKAKLGPKRYGPFTIDQKLSLVVYRLKLLPKWKIHPVFHTGLLYPYSETTMHEKNYLQPPPELIKNQEEFEIECIIDSKTVGKRTLYRVRWKGYLALDDSWLPNTELSHAKDALADFLQPNKE
ncbi:uncharacterized protein FIBRA_09468 [Fibroporia radiculosa]|uniref:Chromo domain-containing protein n=1 Tax=Fibroporia radiculosa TaxID=599839 RepID=J7RHR5_9APHY|nr:uncharacterized protein FIBRA_09468 [Fibroporia radiculosa]CCM07132.1 predicted protein [Fibroporia radiculosa]